MTPLFGKLFDQLDARLHVRADTRKSANKVFPSNWSFLLGEVALFSLVILVLTGIFLTFFYRPNVEAVTYTGSNPVFAGRTLPAAFESIVRLSSDINGGLLFRRLHRGASHLFIATIVLHMLRILLTGAFRKPRELNYFVGIGLLTLAFGAGFTGYSLPYDSLAGTGIRIAYSELLSLPLIGDRVAFWIFGGAFPTGDVIPRFFVLHVMLLPAALIGTVGLHLFMVYRQKHTQFPRVGVDGHQLVLGKPLWPLQFAESTTLFLWTGGLLAAAAVLIPWSDVALLGPYVPGEVGNNAQPDWFLFWLEGALRIFPPIEFGIPGTLIISGPFVAGVVLPGLIFTFLAFYPFLEKWLYKLEGEWHVLQNPLEIPLRAGVMLGVFSALLLLSAAATNDILSRMLGIPIEVMTWFFRITVIVAPIVLGLGIARYARRRLNRRQRHVPSTETEAQQRYIAA
ncbi:MAG: cytochrome b N-terminal domain-containing protein [Actinobacteria bacterium]|nr:cytochrome b N-terminal domain-containing protein [Actinomycetota bacterium]